MSSHSVTLSWESRTKEIGVEGGMISFNSRKGLTGSKELAQRTIEGFMGVLLGEDFDGAIRVGRLTPRILAQVQSLLIFPVINSTGGMDVYVEPTGRPVNTDEFINDAGMFYEMLDGQSRRATLSTSTEEQPIDFTGF